MKETKLDRIEQVNLILPLFAPCLRLSSVRSRLWLDYDDGKWATAKAAVLNRSGCSLACRYGLLGMGGTRAEAVAQLVRWVRDLHRYPLETWQYWTMDHIGLGRPHGSELLEMLRGTSYVDPAKTGCVFCGRQRVRGDGLVWDWFSRKGEPSGLQCGIWGCVLRENA